MAPNFRKGFMENIITEEQSFTLILHAGNAKSSFMEAINYANKGEFDKAEDKMKEAEVELNEAHQMQTDLLVKMANGEACYTDLLMVHAQDHLNNAILMKDLARQIIYMQKEIYDLKKDK